MKTQRPNLTLKDGKYGMSAENISPVVHNDMEIIEYQITIWNASCALSGIIYGMIGFWIITFIVSFNILEFLIKLKERKK